MSRWSVFPNVVLRGAELSPRFALGLMSRLKAVLWLEGAPWDSTLDLVLVTPDEMREVSYRGRGIDAPTDVLTFSQTGEASSLCNEVLFGNGPEGESVSTGSSLCAVDADTRADLVDLGLIYMCVPYIWRRCCLEPTRNLPFSLYLHAALVHAELHALGYDHETPAQLRAMARREQQVGRQLRALSHRYPSLLPPLDGLEYLRNTRPQRRLSARKFGQPPAHSMQPLRHSKRTYRIPQQAVPRAAGENVLQNVALPAARVNTATDEDAALNGQARRRAKMLQRTSSSSDYSGWHAAAARAHDDLGHLDALAFLAQLDTATLTNREAESIMYPYHVHPYAWEDVHAALQDRLAGTTDTVPWFKARTRPGWDTDLRFLGDWWLSLRDPDSDAARKTLVGMKVVDLSASVTSLRPKKGEVNRPLLLAEERTSWAEDQLVADLVLRMHERLFRLETLHIDELPMTPDRLQVLLLAGVLSVQRCETKRIAAALAREPEAEAGKGKQTISGGVTGAKESSAPHPQPILIPPHSAAPTPAAEEGEATRPSSSLRTGERTSLVRSQGGDNVHPPLEELVNGSQDGCAVQPVSQLPEVRLLGEAAEDGGVRVGRELLLQTLSLSICQVGTASALVLLASLVAIEADRRRSSGLIVADEGRSRVAVEPIVNLDLSYNVLTSDSLYCLTMLLPSTALKRLSLRGNNLSGGDGAATRDFLLVGCQHLSELDLSYTELTVQQVCILIEVLPCLTKLRVLLMDNVDIPAEKTTALTRAVYQSQLWSISLNGCVACANPSYLNFIDAACNRHKATALGNSFGSSANTTSFFEQFFTKSLTKGWVPPELRALPACYGPFTNNDPSLFDKDD